MLTSTIVPNSTRWIYTGLLLLALFRRTIQDNLSEGIHGEKPDDLWYFHDGIESDFSPLLHEENERMSIVNMTCDFFTQPLNHFVPRGNSPTYQQRYCIYTDYVPKHSSTTTSPILFYTGNESPVEHYINHTGLMWELAPKLKARVVFVEHRYEGLSVPNVSSQCMSYASTIQALADYAKILEEKINPGNVAAVIAFGGSYGGMLSGWFRMKFPHLVAGAIAASAPIGAFPQSANKNIDGAARVLMTGLSQPYPPNHDHKGPNYCSSNLLAAWPLITWLVQQKRGKFLQESLRLCEPVTDERRLLEWAGAIWFDLAESSFPYPSNYIPFALLHKNVNLPAWPMQAACWNVSRLNEDWGVRFEGDIEDVRYQIKYGDSLVLNVDWEKVDSLDPNSSPDLDDQVSGLLQSLRDAVSIWYNITKDVKCYDISKAAPNLTKHKWDASQVSRSSDQRRHLREFDANTVDIDPAQVCHDEIKRVGSWEPLCCNDEMNLVITNARGLGHDFFWPPSQPRGVKTYRDLIRNITAKPCPDPHDIYGYSKDPYDPLSTWLDTYYGGIDMAAHSNIIFSNGLLDPWSAGGIYKNSEGASFVNDNDDGQHVIVQNITGNDVLAVIIKYGGHHTDLMYSNKADPICVTEARDVEAKYIHKWIDMWHSSRSES